MDMIRVGVSRRQRCEEASRSASQVFVWSVREWLSLDLLHGGCDFMEDWVGWANMTMAGTTAQCVVSAV